jgi:hypothetical protein
LKGFGEGSKIHDYRRSKYGDMTDEASDLARYYSGDLIQTHYMGRALAFMMVVRSV